MSESDVAIIGGGLAGSVAALAARRANPGATVGLVTTTETTFQQASGLIDVLGYTPSGEGPLADPFDVLPKLPETHPYRIVGSETVRGGLALFDDVAGDEYGGGGTDANALVPTCFGRAKPTARYPRSVERGLASEQRKTLLVGFEHLPGFDGPTAADRLAETLPYTLNGITVQFPTDARDPVAFARALDRNATTEDGTTVREELAATVRTYQSGEERIGLPAVLGIEETETILQNLSEAFQVPVFEVPMGPPSVPGRRLASLFARARDEANVEEYVGSRVVGAETENGQIQRVHLAGGGTHEAAQFVLATGGVLGGGVESDREAVREQVFGCHVDAPADRYEWADGDAFGDHQFARFGVSVDEQMRPLTEDGVPEFENLRAAGHVVGGFDFAAEKSGSGISLATGYAAGTEATADLS